MTTPAAPATAAPATEAPATAAPGTTVAESAPSGARSRVVRVTAEQLAAGITANVIALKTAAGTEDLVKIAVDGIRFELYGPAAALFDELSCDSYLAGLPSLPCCAHHDEDRIEGWAAGLEQIVATGTLPD